VPEGDFGPEIIVLITDGKHRSPDPFEQHFLQQSVEVRIYSIGIGSAAGTTLNINGYTVHTQLNETTLEQIAGLTGGVLPCESDEDLREIYANIS
jgi:Ca-activated chloride channel family protein